MVQPYLSEFPATLHLYSYISLILHVPVLRYNTHNSMSRKTCHDCCLCTILCKSILKQKVEKIVIKTPILSKLEFST